MDHIDITSYLEHIITDDPDILNEVIDIEGLRERGLGRLEKSAERINDMQKTVEMIMTYTKSIRDILERHEDISSVADHAYMKILLTKNVDKHLEKTLSITMKLLNFMLDKEENIAKLPHAITKGASSRVRAEPERIKIHTPPDLES